MTIAKVSLFALLAACAAAAQPTLHGMLLDAGCRDRSAVNLRRPPEKFTPSVPVQLPPSANGISVDAKTAQAERADVVSHMAPDLATRQFDPTCAITAGTRAYALLLDNGRFLDLDEGGNTFATDAVNSNPQGREMLNGRAFGFKPTVEVKGTVTGDRLVTDWLQVK